MKNRVLIQFKNPQNFREGTEFQLPPVPRSRDAAKFSKYVPKATGHYLEAHHGTWAGALDCRMPNNEVMFIANFFPSVLMAPTG